MAKASKKTKTSAPSPPPGGVRLTTHPKAMRSVASIRAWAGLAGFGLALLLSLNAGLAPDAALQRALLVGVALFVVAWFAAVTIWRAIVVAEVQAARRRLEARLLAQAQADAAAGNG